MQEEKRVGPHTCETCDFSQNWKDKGIVKNLTLELFPLIVTDDLKEKRSQGIQEVMIRVLFMIKQAFAQVLECFSFK